MPVDHSVQPLENAKHDCCICLHLHRTYSTAPDILLADKEAAHIAFQLLKRDCIADCLGNGACLPSTRVEVIGAL